MSKNSNWRERTKAHQKNVASLLIERALDGMGVRSIEDLYPHPELYGVSPRNRISELGKAGWSIGRKRCGKGMFYWLRRDAEGRSYSQTSRFDEPPHSPRPQLPDAESAFMRRRREEDAAAMPLFAAVRE